MSAGAGPRDDETAKQAARRFSQKWLRKGYKPAALHTYTDRDGQPLFWRIRLAAEDGEKVIRPMSFSDGKYVAREPRFQGKKPLYRLHELSGDDPVFVVEGEMCADRLAALGITGTTSGGAQSAPKADWTPLRGRKVIVWPDADEPGARYARDVIDALRTLDAAVEMVDIKAMSLPEKADCVDWLNQHTGATADDVLQLPRIEPAPPEKPKGIPTVGEDGKPRPQASILTDIGREHHLFHSHGEPYAKVGGGAYALGSSEYREILGREFYRLTGRGANRNAVTDASNTLAAMAKFDGPDEAVYLRVGETEGGIVLDAGTPEWDAYVVTANGWGRAAHPGVHFRRAGKPRPLPSAASHSDFRLLWRHVNVAVEHRVLVAAWLLAALRPCGPYPLLALVAEQGSGKSYTTRTLKSLADPSSSPLRAPPRDERDLLVAAVSSWVLALDNLSGIDHVLSDALCRLSTGGALSGRRLYTNDEEVLIEVQRPVILNGIDDLATRPDLAERCLHVQLPPIRTRAAESDLKQAFHRDADAIFAALLDGVSLALKRVEHVELGPLPRMADFAKWAAAGIPALGFTEAEFLDAYRANLASAVETGLESSSVGHALRALMSHRDAWKGSSKELLRTLTEIDEVSARMAAWPRSPKGMVNALRRLAPALRHVGIRWRHVRTSGGNLIELSCEPSGQVPKPPHAPPETPGSGGIELMEHGQSSHTPPEADIDDVEAI